jgi:hypothetical protein
MEEGEAVVVPLHHVEMVLERVIPDLESALSALHGWGWGRI